jgi:hypothetical protein
MVEYLICVLIMTLLEVNENHLQSLKDMEGKPDYNFGVFQTWVSILIRLVFWILPGSIFLYFLFGVVYKYVIGYFFI